MLSKKILAEVLKTGIFHGRKYMYWRGTKCIYRCLFLDYRKHPNNYDIEIVKWLPKNLWIEV